MQRAAAASHKPRHGEVVVFIPFFIANESRRVVVVIQYIGHDDDDDDERSVKGTRRVVERHI
jgi:hypothetical protein